MSLNFLFIISLYVTSIFGVDYNPSVISFKKILSEMIEANTTNPPGKEARVVTIVERRLKEEKIPYKISEFAKGRENIVARVKGTGELRPLLIIAHTDVVGTQGQTWSTPPHRLTEKDGFLIGRGVSDDLGMAAMGIEVLALLKNGNIKLKRDVILALTGDEESGGEGVQYLLRNDPESIDAEYALNEGGGIILGPDGRVKYLELQTAEKIYQDYLLKIRGTTGHSSVPLKDNAIYRLSEALTKLSGFQFPSRLLPVTKSYFENRSALEPSHMAKAMTDLTRSKGHFRKQSLDVIEQDPSLSSALRTTCVATMFQSGTRVNALPAEAQANINCRILPDENEKDIFLALKRTMNDPTIEITPLEKSPLGGDTPVEGAVKDAITRIARSMWPNVPIIPTLSNGATDSRFLRKHGIKAYGIDTIPNTEEDLLRAHGEDERIPVKSIPVGIEFFYRLVVEIASPSSEYT